MSEEDLEKTGILKEMLSKEDEDEMTINEMIEEFLEEVDYLEIDDKKKKKLKTLALQIQEEKNEQAKEFLFNELKKIANEEEQLLSFYNNSIIVFTNKLDLYAAITSKSSLPSAKSEIVLKDKKGMLLSLQM